VSRQPSPFVLTDLLLAEHASGLLLCLAPSARGQSFSLLAERPAGAGLAYASQGRRADSRVWAPLVSPAQPGRDGPDDEVDSDHDPASDRHDGMGDLAEPPPGVGEPGVVRVVEVRGMLGTEVQEKPCGVMDGYHGPGGVVDRVRQALAASPAGVVVDILSPGGAAMGCGEAAAELAAMVAASPVPVSVYARMAASGGYYLASALASAGGCLCVSESSDVGCIGTFRVHQDMSAANEEAGVKLTYVEDPNGKTAGHPDAPPSDEALERMQRDVSESTDRFVRAVAAFRPDVPDARTLRGDVRRGQSAVDEGLADYLVGGLLDVIAMTYSRALMARPLTVTTRSAA
jgi:ClpP class serine protease